MIARWALLATLALAGCDDVAFLGQPVHSLTLLDGAVTAAGPEGYCIDAQSSRMAQGFAVLGSCALLSNLGLIPQTQALMTVQFGEAGSASVVGAEADLASLLRSAQGAALLSATGDSRTVAVDDVETGPGIVLVRFADTAPPLVPGLEATEWRAFLDIRGRLTTLTLRGFERAPISRDAALAVVTQAVQALRAANSLP